MEPKFSKNQNIVFTSNCHQKVFIGLGGLVLRVIPEMDNNICKGYIYSVLVDTIDGDFLKVTENEIEERK